MSQYPIKPTVQQSTLKSKHQEPVQPTVQQNVLSPPTGEAIPTLSNPAGPILGSQMAQTLQSSKKQAEPKRDPAADRARAFQPLFRPPMALLDIIDDGGESEESVRIRGEALTIGRSQGDVVIPHDGQMSGMHAKISRRLENRGYEWFLSDLNSRNGTFIRVARVPLADGQMFLLGSHRYVYRAAATPAAAAPADRPAGTQGWQTVSPADLARLTPTLVRLNPDGAEKPFPLMSDQVTLGQDPAVCGIVLDDDPAVSTLHAKIRRDERGGLVLEDANSRNGIWLAIQEHRFRKSIRFQLGEQRFRLRILPCT
ncbi:MAG TPA: FHA domain-containing protein [Planctomycetaceae bacterium]|jgi:pSer/pThr/pTyr-binding forkhead associated (FHA) protein|nr:FHA domain-containing protein [Planctomycetaceae bacterium]